MGSKGVLTSLAFLRRGPHIAGVPKSRLHRFCRSRQTSELGVRTSELGVQKSENGVWKPENGARKPENAGKRSPVSKWASVRLQCACAPCIPIRKPRRTRGAHAERTRRELFHAGGVSFSASVNRSSELENRKTESGKRGSEDTELRFPFSVFRFPRSVFRFPNSDFRSPSSEVRTSSSDVCRERQHRSNRASVGCNYLLQVPKIAFIALLYGIINLYVFNGFN